MFGVLCCASMYSSTKYMRTRACVCFVHASTEPAGHLECGGSGRVQVTVGDPSLSLSVCVERSGRGRTNKGGGECTSNF